MDKPRSPARRRFLAGAVAAALPSEPFSSVLQSRSDSDDGVVIQIWNRNGALMYFSHPRVPLAPHAELGSARASEQ